MNQFINGAPMTNLLGINDKSTRALAVEPEAIPTHLAKVYIFAQKGRPNTPQLVVSNGRDALFGSDTFDSRKKYFNHQTMLANRLNSVGNAQMIERVIPDDAGPKANFLLSIDLLPYTVPIYQRGLDGKLVLGNDGLPIPVTGPGSGTINGYKVKWVVTSVTTKNPGQVDSDLFGVAAQAPGDQTNGQTQSTRYPIMEFWADSEGEVFNNSGLRIFAPTTNSQGGINTSIMGTNKVYPFRMQAITRASADSTAKIKETLQGESYFDFTLRKGVINPATDAEFSLDKIYLSKYQSTSDKRFVPLYADFSNFKLYENNIDAVLTMLAEAEENYFDEPGNDFSVSDSAQNQKYLYNFFTLTSSTGVQYRSAVLNTTDANAVRLSEGTNIWAKGGSDGTLSAANFNSLVSARVSEYANPNSSLMDTAINVESIIYDSGFPLSVKRDLCKFISQRKDTAVVLSTYVVDGDVLSVSEENSVAIALKTYLQNYPESDYFGTGITRGVIMGWSGRIRGTNYDKKLPLTLDLAKKAARFMGAGNGKWNPVYLFDRAPANNVEDFDFDPEDIKFVPAQQTVLDWEVGLNYPRSYSRSAQFYPAIKTVYEDDTSVLNSFFTMMAAVELQKVGERTWRNFSGAVGLTNAQLIERVNRDVEAQTQGRFANLFIIKPAAYISQGDEARGYSWTLPIELYANNMKTVMTLSVESYRMSDYTQ